VGAPNVSAAPSTEAVDTINDRYATFGGASSLLGAPLGEAVDIAGGAERDYTGGTIFYSKDSGAHVMYGEILKRYEALGGPDSDLGFPKNDETGVGDGVGRFNDFSAPEGAAIYWSPQWGATVIKGKVLEAWRQSGAVTGPFGYPSADTSVTDDLQTGKFVGPEGTEIQWSKAAGLATIPAALAAKIPGFGADAPTAEGTTSVSAAPGKTITTEKVEKKGFNWLWLLLGIPLIAGLGWLLRKRPQEVAPVRVAERAPVVKPTPPPARPAPVAKAPAPAPKPPAPRPPAPVTKVTPPPAPKPVTPPPAPRPLLSEPPKATIHTETTDHDVTTVVRYEESSAAVETSARVTYENNALGDDQESVADKSDSVPD
jgi:outer membrane biosynthesis protein TonB/ribosomal protein L35AE/L33A